MPRRFIGALAVAALTGIPDAPEKVQPLSVGDEAPNAELRTIRGEKVELATRFGKKPAILIFYRGGW